MSPGAKEALLECSKRNDAIATQHMHSTAQAGCHIIRHVCSERLSKTLTNTLLHLQINTTVSPLPGLTINQLTINVSPGLFTASTNGTLSGNTSVMVTLTSAASAGNSTQRIGSVRLTSQSATGLAALLAAQSTSIRADLGFDVPIASSANSSSSSSSSSSNNNTPVNAEVVIDPSAGLRLLNFTMSTGTKLSLGDLASQVGFPWEGSEGSDIISFTGPRLYYVPNRPGAPALEWAGKPLNALELGITSTVEAPVLGMIAVSGTLLVQPGGNLTIRVSFTMCSVCCQTWQKMHTLQHIAMQSNHLPFHSTGAEVTSCCLCHILAHHTAE